MMSLLRNMLLRLWQKKNNLWLYLALTTGSILVAIALSHQSSQFASVAVIQDDQMPLLYEDNVDIHYVNERPLETDLVTQKYDAFIESKDQQWSVYSYKTKDFEEQLMHLLTNPNISLPQEKQVGETIFGFMIMFVMMEALFFTTLYGEDKESSMLQRIGLSGCSILRYFVSQSLLTVLLTWGSTFGILIVVRLFGFDIGFRLFDYGILLFLLSVFSTAFSIMMNTLFDKETTNLSASSLIVLTSLLSGTFYSFIGDDGIIGTCIQFLPQKVFMNLSNNIRNLQSYGLEIVYLLGVSIIFYIVSIYMGKKSMISSHH